MAGNGGEARRRAQAADRGKPIPALKRCPVKKCGSTRNHRHGAGSRLAKKIAQAWGNKHACPIDQCKDCGNFWEPLPDDDPGDLFRDDVVREPCDNCAYRVGSNESRDPERWRELVELAERAAEMPMFAAGRPWFCCHKGVPIKISKGAIEFDFAAVDVQPIHRTCAGFLRVLWAHNGATAKKLEQQTGAPAP